MNRRLFLKLSAAFGFGAPAAGAVPGKAPKPAEWPSPMGPWDCVHDKGAHACHGIAFRALVMPIVGRPMNAAEFQLLDGTTPKARDRVICGTCGADLGREKVFPLSIMPRVPQPQPSRRKA